MNHFQLSCGATGPLRLISGERGWSLPQPFAVIGRDSAADLVLNHPEVSRRHAYLQVIRGRLFCIDLGSRTGIRWNDGLPASSRWIDPGESLGIGPFEIRATADGGFRAVSAPGTDRLPNPLEAAPAGPEPLLEIGPAPEVEPFDRFLAARGPLSAELTLVGTALACGVRLPAKSVSRYQCALLRTARGTWVVDLLGRHGIAVNELGVRYGRLMAGDELRIGPFLARLQRDPEGARDGGREADGNPRNGPTAGRSTSLATTGTAPTSSSLLPFDGPASPVPTSGADLARLLGEVGQMQSQMLSSYNQSMMMAMQMFSTFCREESRTVRGELRMAREIVEELRALKERGETPPAPGPEPPTTGGRRPAGAPRAPREGEDATPKAQSYQEVCLWLCQRADQMDDRQQDRWRRVLKSILGGDRGK